MSAVVTCSVSSYPSTTIASESPTRIMSTPAASTVRADGASYAVTITSGGLAPLCARIAGAVVRAIEAAITAPPPSRARAAPGGTREGSQPRGSRPDRATCGRGQRRNGNVRQLRVPRRRADARSPRLRVARVVGARGFGDGRARDRAVVHLVLLAVPERARRRVSGQLACRRPCSDWRRRWFHLQSRQTSTS